MREEWRVVDRWWTEEPVSRRYFDVVLAGGERAVVFHDEEVGRWFSQRGRVEGLGSQALGGSRRAVRAG